MSDSIKWGGPRPGAGRRPTHEEPKRSISVSLPTSVIETLDGIAEQRETPRSGLVEEAVSAWLVGGARRD